MFRILILHSLERLLSFLKKTRKRLHVSNSLGFLPPPIKTEQNYFLFLIKFHGFFFPILAPKPSSKSIPTSPPALYSPIISKNTQKQEQEKRDSVRVPTEDGPFRGFSFNTEASSKALRRVSIHTEPKDVD